MYVLRSDAVRQLDADTIAAGPSGHTLMLRAARSVARNILSVPFRRSDRPSALIAVGPGNNGGDGFGVAIHLQEAGWAVRVWCACSQERIRGDAALLRDEWLAAGGCIEWRCDATQWSDDSANLPLVDLVVDALLGTGSTGAPRGAIAAAVKTIKRYGEETWVVAVDLPSGFYADTGSPVDVDLCVRADQTLTLGAAKPGFLLSSSRAWTGPVEVLDLGFEKARLETLCESNVRVISRPEIDVRAPDSHKGSFGHLGIIGGGVGMAGAAILAARGALRAGAGKVTVCVHPSNRTAVHSACPEAMVREWPADFGSTDEFDWADALVVGPGLGGVEPVGLARLVGSAGCPLLLDADGLNHLAGRWELLRQASGPRVITPHPGEMARWFRVGTQDVQSNRNGYVEEARAKSGATLVLKGAATLVAGADGVFTNLNGNAGLATAGSGDVQAGICGAYLAMGVTPEVAARDAVYWHGRAGDTVAARKGERAVLAGDLPDALYQ